MTSEVEAETGVDRILPKGEADPVGDTGLRQIRLQSEHPTVPEPTDQKARARQAREAKKERLVLKLADDLELRKNVHNWIVVDGRHRSFYPHNGWWAVLDALLAIARKRHLGKQKVADLQALLRSDREAQAQAMLWARELRLALGGPEQPSETHFWEAVAILAVEDRLHRVVGELRRGRDADAILRRLHSQGDTE